MNKLLYSIVLVIILALPATTQVRTQNRDYETKPITAFAYPWYRIDSTTTIVHICYRIQPSFFTFLKGKNEHQSFEARGELVLDILNEENITVRHTYKLLTFTQPSLQKIDDIERFYFTSVPLSPGTYRLLVELKDNNSPREYRNREYIFTIAKAIDTVSLMSMVFCSLLKSDSNRPHFSLLLYDGAIPFASSGGLFVNTTNHLDQSVSVEWSIVPKIVPAYEGGTSHHGKLFEHYTHFDITECNHQLCLVQSTSTLPFKQYYIPLPLEKLIPGTYELSLIHI
ncbi:MAG: hypothetical protein N3A63_07545, partial [Bacteroidetes bacterium]|nr:hypothetical protein [Bacteroidota bacterium]